MINKKIFLEKLAEDIYHLPPGYFALVMATGIVSIAAHNLGSDKIAYPLFGINVIAYISLWLLNLRRFILYPKAMLADFLSYHTGPTFFTLPAASCVLGSQSILLTSQTIIGEILLAVGIISWLGIMYGFFYGMTITPKKPSLEEGLVGAWSLPIVSTFSIAITTTLLAVHLSEIKEDFLFISLIFFLIGSVLYIFIISLMFYRFFFFRFSPAILTPPYWINMGVEAIATLAGAILILNKQYWGFLEEILPFLKGVTLAFWAMSNWWFPLLLLLGIWRHMVHQIPILRYNMQYWSMVFPLGMYTNCTFQLGKIIPLDLIKFIPFISIIFALTAWILVFIGLCHYLKRHYINFT
ncbi:tellurite resistance/C4-dicarboxylate transporter family protein [Candidatus Nitrosacidococcus tergens]|uniref:Putative C4-dicarboxylate transporter protein n=1 Tax=Candidatus Nitrosacidococcus tergens TaxID=553981 RepID=A0A7G1Q966_9GAMM|nr:tellurite resistance/C4-dicarboxylate transporter family protein [Candidatus Nitrosacidococcus tergens]CAB1275525.1 putative C4-dicarboxylate transporter protein [Candidatus Nitrosacidococcus tergens]